MLSVGFPLPSPLTNTGPWQRQGREIAGSVEGSSTNKFRVTKTGSYSYHFLVLTQFPALFFRLFWRLPGWQTCFEGCQPLCRAPLLLGAAVLENNGWEQGEGLLCAGSLWSHLARVQTEPACGHCWLWAFLILSHWSIGTVLCLVSFIYPSYRFSHPQPSWSSSEQERDVGTRDAPKRGSQGMSAAAKAGRWTSLINRVLPVQFIMTEED